MNAKAVIAAIEARGLKVTAHVVNGSSHNLTVQDSQGTVITWPEFRESSKGMVNWTAFPSYHGGNILPNVNEHAFAAIYADVYLSFKGKPTAAEKALRASLQANPIPQVQVSVPLTQSSGLGTLPVPTAPAVETPAEQPQGELIEA